MPIPFVDISSAPYTSWADIREAVADCIATVEKPETTGARIYPHWVYEIDINSMLGKVTGAMRATSGTSNGKVHCWCIGVSAAAFQTNQGGFSPTVGAQNAHWTWNLTLDVWGFFEYDGLAASQKNAEDRARTVSAALYRNAGVIVASVPNLSAVNMLNFPSLSPTPMSGGQTVSVCAGTMIVSVNEALGL